MSQPEYAIATPTQPNAMQPTWTDESADQALRIDARAESFAWRCTGEARAEIGMRTRWQKGMTLGSPEAVAHLSSGNPWLYDRASGVLLDIPYDHCMTSGAIYLMAHPDSDESIWTRSDAYAREGLGFWLSSCPAVNKRIVTGTNLSLTGQERMAFKRFIFDRIL